MLANQVFAGTFPIFVNLFPTGGAAAPPNPQAETPMVETLRYSLKLKLGVAIGS